MVPAESPKRLPAVAETALYKGLTLHEPDGCQVLEVEQVSKKLVTSAPPVRC